MANSSSLMAAVRAGTLACAGARYVRRSVNPRTAATLLFDSRQVVASLKDVCNVEDRLRSPQNHHSLEDTIIQASEYALCAQTVAHQAIQPLPKSPVSLRVLLESALQQMQVPAGPRTLH